MKTESESIALPFVAVALVVAIAGAVAARVRGCPPNTFGCATFSVCRLQHSTVILGERAPFCVFLRRPTCKSEIWLDTNFDLKPGRNLIIFFFLKTKTDHRASNQKRSASIDFGRPLHHPSHPTHPERKMRISIFFVSQTPTFHFVEHERRDGLTEAARLALSIDCRTPDQSERRPLAPAFCQCVCVAQTGAPVSPADEQVGKPSNTRTKTCLSHLLSSLAGSNNHPRQSRSHQLIPIMQRC
jgi:hypothetical protein